MPPLHPHKQSREGHISGLRLPPRVWRALWDEKIRTVEQVAAMAGELERIPDIGPGHAKTIQSELQRHAELQVSQDAAKAECER